VVVDDFHVFWLAGSPAEAEAVLVIDPEGVLAAATSRERFDGRSCSGKRFRDMAYAASHRFMSANSRRRSYRRSLALADALCMPRRFPPWT